MGTVPIHESVAKVATRDLLGVENGFAVSKTGHIALLRHNQIQWLVRPISGAGQMIDGHRLHNAAALRTPLRQPLLGPRGADNPPDCVRPSPGDL